MSPATEFCGTRRILQKATKETKVVIFDFKNFVIFVCFCYLLLKASAQARSSIIIYVARNRVLWDAENFTEGNEGN